jgi:DNA-binding transcriptional ArsR family regulator
MSRDTVIALTVIYLVGHVKYMDTFALLAEPSRRRIVELLQHGERAVGELVERLGSSQPAVSKHLRVLRDAGLVSVRRVGQRRMYSVRPERLQELDAWLEPYRLVWSGRLDALEEQLERMAEDD